MVNLNTSICESIVDVIGNTPLLALDRITGKTDGRILAKLEYLNPGFSKKDRAALQTPADSGLGADIQERAWTSPIWYLP